MFYQQSNVSITCSFNELQLLTNNCEFFPWAKVTKGDTFLGSILITLVLSI